MRAPGSSDAAAGAACVCVCGFGCSEAASGTAPRSPWIASVGCWCPAGYRLSWVPGARQADPGALRKKRVQAQDRSLRHRPQAQTSGAQAACAGLGAKEDSGTLPSPGLTFGPELWTHQQAIRLKRSELQSRGASAHRAPGTAAGGAGSRRSPGKRELDLMLWGT